MESRFNHMDLRVMDVMDWMDGANPL